MMSSCNARRVSLALLSLLIVLFAGVPPSGAQGLADRSVSPACPTTKEEAAGLASRKSALEKTLADKRAQFGQLPAAPAAQSGQTARAALAREIEALEGDLVDLIYTLDCQRTNWEPQVRTRSLVAAKPDFIEITTYYATNRKATGSAAPLDYYGTEDATALQYGRMAITIPAAHEVGNIELPSLWKLEMNPDPSKHFVIKELSPLENAKALEELRAASGKKDSRSLLVFVHGFNTSFAEAALRTAQLAHDLEFPGVPMFMSWPASKVYTHSTESVELAKGPFNALLDDIAALPFDKVYILAHSMGTRLVAKVLAARKQSGADLSKIQEVLLAAPDINTHIFTSEIAPVLSGLSTMRKTIYASSDDLALKASSAVNGYPRVGQTTDGVTTFPGFETIDCSKIAPLRRAWGHSYLFDSSSVIADLGDALIGGKEAAKRGLKRTGIAPAMYWMME
jgi:esterase/lipase superfamily enzyme